MEFRMTAITAKDNPTGNWCGSEKPEPKTSSLC